MELKILHWFEELHNPVLDFLMYQITCLGNGGLIWLVIALLGDCGGNAVCAAEALPENRCDRGCGTAHFAGYL